jgi:cytochrome c-type biogenesis protein CcsB
MMVDASLATYSDWCYAGAVIVYLLALVLHGVQFAAGRQREPERSLVAAGARGAGTSHTGTPTGSRTWSATTGRMAVSLTVLGALIHATSLLLRGVAVQRVPWGNMYEFGSAICLAAVVCWLVLLRRHDVQRLGVFVLLPTVILLFTSGTLLYAKAAPLQPALRSYWIAIHVFAAMVAFGLLLVAGAASVGYLLRTNGRAEKPQNSDDGAKHVPGAQRLPAADVLDRLAYRATIVAFPVWTFAIITGAIWAETAWGRYWGWDPKETVALVAWVVYAGYLHARATAGWRRGAAWVNVAGIAVMIFNLFFVNLVVSGFHSYAGVG